MTSGAPLRPVSVRVRPTPAGLMLLGVTFVTLWMAWAGAGAGFSLLAMFECALVLVAAVATWRHASSLRIAAPGPVTAFAGERFTLDVPVTNHARFAVSCDVLVSVDGTLPGRTSIGALLDRIGPGKTERAEVMNPARRRGLHPQGRLELTSAFPIGLFECSIRFALPDDVLVLPRLGTLRRVARNVARVRSGGGHGGVGRGDEQEIYGIRAWRDGEGLRSVHWKLSARRGRLLVREFRSEPRPPVRIVLLTALPVASRRMRNAFEDAVSLAATLAERELRNGSLLRLTIAGRATRTIPCRRGRGAILPVLRALAEVESEPGTDAPHSDAPLVRRRPDERTYVVRVGTDVAPESLKLGATTVFNVTDRGLAAFYDRRRRPGSALLLGVR